MENAEVLESPIAQFQVRATERLKRVRAELAWHLNAKKTAERLSYSQIKDQIGIDKSTMCHLLNPAKHGYPDPGTMKLAVALEWVDLTWGDLDRPLLTRKLTLADGRLAIEDYDLTREHRNVMLAMHDELYLALTEAEKPAEESNDG